MSSKNGWKISTKNGWKLSHIIDFLEKCSCEKIRWFVECGQLHGLILDMDYNTITSVMFQFENFTTHDPIHFNIITCQFLKALSSTGRGDILTLEFSNDSVVVIRERVDNSETRCPLPISIQDCNKNNFHIEHVGPIHNVKTSLLSCLSKELGSSKPITFKTLASSTNSLVIETDSLSFYISDTTKIEPRDEIFIETVPKLLTPWKKTFANITPMAQVSISDNNICIFITDDGWHVKYSWKK